IHFMDKKIMDIISTSFDLSGIVENSDYVQVHVKVHPGPLESSAGQVVHVGTGFAEALVDQCQEVIIPIVSNEALSALQTNEYLHFEIEPSNTAGFGPAGLGVLPQTTLFVMDNLSWCALIGLAVSNPLCGESLCAEIFQECGTQCDEGPEAECESFGCCVSFSWS